MHFAFLCLVHASSYTADHPWEHGPSNPSRDDTNWQRIQRECTQCIQMPVVLSWQSWVMRKKWQLHEPDDKKRSWTSENLRLPTLATFPHSKLVPFKQFDVLLFQHVNLLMLWMCLCVYVSMCQCESGTTQRGLDRTPNLQLHPIYQTVFACRYHWCICLALMMQLSWTFL